MNLVVTHHLTIHIVIHRCVILRIVANTCRHTRDAPDIVHSLVLLNELLHSFLQLAHALRGEEDRRLIHVIPEALYTCIREDLIFCTEPASRLRVQHIREMRISRPYRRNEITSICSLTEVVICHALLIHIVAFLYLYSGIDDRDQAYIILFQILHILRKIAKVVIYGEILIAIHIIYIHVDHIDRDVVLSIFSRHRLKVLRCLVSPAALSKSKCKLWRDITPSDHLPELLCDIIWAVTCYHIDIHICAVTENMHLIALRISHVKCDSGWIVKIQAKCLRS